MKAHHLNKIGSLIKFRQSLKVVAVGLMMVAFQNCGGKASHVVPGSANSSLSSEAPSSEVPTPRPETTPIPSKTSGATYVPYNRSCNSAGISPYDYVKDVKPVVTKHCSSCHMNGQAQGGFSLPNYATDEAARLDKNVWNHALAAVNSNLMPKNRVMSPQEKSILNQWFSTSPTGVSDPGFVPMQRLTGRQWDNSVSDLLGTVVSQSSKFPADPIGRGQFTNNAATIGNMTVEFFNVLRTATDAAVEGAFANSAVKAKLLNCGASSPSPIGTVSIPVKENANVTYVGADGSTSAATERMISGGRLVFNLDASYFPQDVTSVTPTLGGPQRGNVWPGFKLYVDNVLQGPQIVATNTDMWKPFVVPVNISANNAHQIAIEFSNDDPSIGGLDLWVQKIEFTGNTGGGSSSGVLSASCAETLLLDFARRAFRRPISTMKDQDDPNGYVESEAIKALIGNASTVAELETAVQMGFKAILMSPSFLYRTIILTFPNDATSLESLDAFELAAQLSYFLWNTIPDETLYNSAKTGDLLSEAGLKAQVQRMLADSRSSQFSLELANGWFTLQELQRVSPSDPIFKQSTRDAMAEETRRFIQHIVQNNRSPLELLTANYSFINDELANIYGISAPGSTELTKTVLPSTRHGILTHGSMMTFTTKGAETSPIIRGVWALRNVVCADLPNPPPNIPNLDHSPVDEASIRDLLAAHRNNPACFSCHSHIDPMGLSLENYDSLGRFRETYANGRAVDAVGDLPDGSHFNGAGELAEVIRENKSFQLCMTKKSLALSLARDVASSDLCAIEKIGLDHVGESKTFVDFINALVLSDPFKKRRGSGE